MKIAWGLLGSKRKLKKHAQLLSLERPEFLPLSFYPMKLLVPTLYIFVFFFGGVGE